jgi:hypothetical protein
MNQRPGQFTYDKLGGRRLCARRSPDAPYVMARSPDASFAAMSLTDIYATTNSLADALAENVDLFNLDGSPILVRGGQIIPVTLNTLHEIIPQFIATKELVNRGTETNPNWIVDYVPYAPDPRTLRDLFANERREGGLLPRLTKVTSSQVSEPRRQKVFVPPAG